MQKYIEICIIKTSAENFQTYMKINRNTTQPKKENKETFRKGIRKNENWYQENKKGYHEQK